MSNMKYWLFLLLSILFEVTGTSIMKASQTMKPLAGMLLMYVLISLSYLSLSKAVTRIPIGVAYAFWEALGLILITCVSFFFLGEQLGAKKVFALFLLLTGSYMVHLGTGHSEEVEK